MRKFEENMLENAIEEFCDNIFLFITGENKTEKSLLIKKHTENLQCYGDFSFPNTLKSWHDFVSERYVDNSDANLMKCVGKETDDLVRESKKWTLQVNRLKEENGRIHIFLERSKAIRTSLLEALKNNAFVSQKICEQTSSAIRCDPLCEDKDCLTSLRLKYLSKSIQNLYSIQSNCREKAQSIFISSKSSSRSSDNKMILCGTVLNAKTGAKESVIKADDFIRIRQDEMTLIAQHKYGVRVSTDSKWREFIDHLGESAVIFELLQTRPSSAVKINFDCSSAGSSKGAAFILYNCARLETIIRTFNEKVEEKTYPPLPDFENIDFTLLTHEDEWSLIFNFIMGLPSLLSSCMDTSDGRCEFRPHHICSYLSSMVRVFSQYYRQVRILTGPRAHLLAVMFARVHMLKILSGTLKTCLTILDIKSVAQMCSKCFIIVIRILVQK